MAKVRLTASRYDQPAGDFEALDKGEKFDAQRQTHTRLQGEVFEVSNAERDRLFEQGAAEEVKDGDDKPNEALRELAEAQLSRMRKEHDTLSKRQGVSKSEVDLSEARLKETERRFASAQKGHARASRVAKTPGAGPVPPGDEKPAGTPDPDK